MTIQASAQVTWEAADAQEAMDTVNSWVVHEGAQITLMLEQPERAITQQVMGHVSITPAVADGAGSVTLLPDDPDAWPAPPPVEEPPPTVEEPPAPDAPHPEHPIVLPEPPVPDEEPVDEPVARQLDSITPASGTKNGGTAVTLAGQGFTDADTVTFKDAAVTDIEVVDDRTITCVTPVSPTGGKGKMDVTVSGGASGDAVLLGGYQFT